MTKKIRDLCIVRLGNIHLVFSMLVFDLLLPTFLPTPVKSRWHAAEPAPSSTVALLIWDQFSFLTACRSVENTDFRSVNSCTLPRCFLVEMNGIVQGGVFVERPVMQIEFVETRITRFEYVL